MKLRSRICDLSAPSTLASRLPSRLEKIAQEFARLAGADTSINLRPMMAGFLRKKTRAVFHRATLFVLGGEIEPAQSGEGNGAGAHGAGLQRHIEIAAGEALIAKYFRGGAVDQHFGVSSRIVVFDRAIAGAGDDLAV